MFDFIKKLFKKKSKLHIANVSAFVCPECDTINTRKKSEGIYVCNRCGYSWAYEH